jgi:anti-sigma factor ChrR (cupin superfamily)
MLNTDFSQRVVLDTLALPWQASPSPQVWRRQLERDGGECARATSIVRYDPGARFPEHGHEFGEEIIVLDGVFSDQHGDYGPGTYVKNPPGSRHAPFSVDGCTLFVKLRHLDPADRGRVIVNFRQDKWYPGMVPGLTVLPLSEFATQHTAMVRWAPETCFNPHRHYGGEEIFVVEGTFADEFGEYPAGTWLRSPHLGMHKPFSHEGCLIFVKTGHLHVAGVSAAL